MMTPEEKSALRSALKKYDILLSFGKIRDADAKRKFVRRYIDHLDNNEDIPMEWLLSTPTLMMECLRNKQAELKGNCDDPTLLEHERKAYREERVAVSRMISYIDEKLNGII